MLQCIPVRIYLVNNYTAINYLVTIKTLLWLSNRALLKNHFTNATQGGLSQNFLLNLHYVSKVSKASTVFTVLKVSKEFKVFLIT